MAYTNDDLANLIKVQADRICQEIRAASENVESAPSASTNNAMDAIAAANEYCRTHPTVGDRAIIFLAGVEWRQQHQ